MTYEDLNINYKDKMKDLENVSTVLNSTMLRVQARDEELQRIEKKLRDFANDLNLSKKRELELGDHFKDLKGEKEEITDILNKTEVEKGRYENLYNQYYTDYRVCKQDYDTKVTELNSANTKLSGMITDVTQISQKSELALSDIDGIIEKLDKVYSLAQSVDKEAKKIENDTVKDNIKNDASEIKRESKTGDDDNLKSLIESVQKSMDTIRSLASSIQNG